MSGLPSPSISVMTRLPGFVDEKSTLGANEMFPLLLVFLRTETEKLFTFVTTKSGLPSPSISYVVTKSGLDPVVMSTLGANEFAVIEPEALVFLKTETVLSFEFATMRSGFPSPSTSHMDTPWGNDPVIKSMLEAKDDVFIICELGNVIMKGVFVYAVNPFTVTEIGLYVAPVGTITLSEVEVALFTTAFTAPKYTTLFAAVPLKFVPVMVTVVPMDPEVGEKEVIEGICAKAMLVERRNKKACRVNLPKVALDSH